MNISFVKYFRVVGKEMTKNGQTMAIFESSISGFFLQKLKKVETEKIMFYEVTCDPIEI